MNSSPVTVKVGAYPVYKLAPLDYRFALDAARAFLSGTEETGPVEIWNNLPALAQEIAGRFGESKPKGTGVSADAAAAAAADANIAVPTAILWVEPLVGDWQARLRELAETREVQRLVIINSGFLAARLPERQGWPKPPSLGQFRRLRRALKEGGFIHRQVFEVHTLTSIILNQLSHRVGQLGKPALADRLQFASRRSYYRQGWSVFATVGLGFFERKHP